MLVAPLFLLFVLTVILVAVSLAARPQPAAPESGWGRGTRFFLVLLRLAIGWHFLIEGLDKLHDQGWTSETYLRESVGPLAPVFRDLAGDRLAERLTVGADGGLPPALEAEWDAYFERFKDRYDLDENQEDLARAILAQVKAEALETLTVTKRPVAVPSPKSPSLMVDMTLQERLAELKKREERVRQIQNDELPAASKREEEETFARLRDAKASAARLRADLKAELAGLNSYLVSMLAEGPVLTAGQLTSENGGAVFEVPGFERTAKTSVEHAFRRSLWHWSLLDWSDFLVKWGLVVVGGCLLLGLLTRTACVVGAGYLLMFFLAMPPLPGYPESPRAEGHYLYVNKNIIEMFALLALATTRSGRWAGLDALFALFRRHPEGAPARAPYPNEPRPAPDKGGPIPLIMPAPPSSKERTHGP